VLNPAVFIPIDENAEFIKPFPLLEKAFNFFRALTVNESKRLTIIKTKYSSYQERWRELAL